MVHGEGHPNPELPADQGHHAHSRPCHNRAPPRGSYSCSPPPHEGKESRGPRRHNYLRPTPLSPLSMWHQGMLFPKALGPSARPAWTSFSWCLSRDCPAGLCTPGLPSVQSEGGLNPNFLSSTQFVDSSEKKAKERRALSGPALFRAETDFATG